MVGLHIDSRLYLVDSVYSATVPISTIFFTFVELSIATLGVITVPSLCPIMLIGQDEEQDVS
jgi:hypothetical protein